MEPRIWNITVHFKTARTLYNTDGESEKKFWINCRSEEAARRKAIKLCAKFGAENVNRYRFMYAETKLAGTIDG